MKPPRSARSPIKKRRRAACDRRDTVETVTRAELSVESSIAKKMLNRQRNLWNWREELNHPTVAWSAQKLALPAPAKGARSGRLTVSPASANVTLVIPRVADPLARSPRRGHVPFETSRLEV